MINVLDAWMGMNSFPLMSSLKNSVVWKNRRFISCAQRYMCFGAMRDKREMLERGNLDRSYEGFRNGDNVRTKEGAERAMFPKSSRVGKGGGHASLN